MSNDTNIFVTKTYLPPIDDFQKYVNRIWQSSVVTNQGELLQEFENKVTNFINVDNFHFVTNGTVALQLALKALDIDGGEVITTPFSYVATTNSILWERCKPVFVDIEPNTLAMNPQLIEKSITSKTRAIMPVHVFGIPCNIQAIDHIAKKHGLKVIYDAAHAFGVIYNGKSLLDYGDISVGSFHATKVFHTIEGGCLVVKSNKINTKVDLLKRFGHIGDNYYLAGINAKASEFQAAMGICNLEHLDEIIEARKQISEVYDKLLENRVIKQKVDKSLKYNYAYYPIILESEKQLLRVIKSLNENNIYPRRYFYPSLNTLSFAGKYQNCPISEDIALRILCLPLYKGLSLSSVNKICALIINNLN